MLVLVKADLAAVRAAREAEKAEKSADERSAE